MNKKPAKDTLSNSKPVDGSVKDYIPPPPPPVPPAVEENPSPSPSPGPSLVMQQHGVLLQQMMYTLVQSYPALAMNPAALQSMAMQHLLQLQQLQTMQQQPMQNVLPQLTETGSQVTSQTVGVNPVQTQVVQNDEHPPEPTVVQTVQTPPEPSQSVEADSISTTSEAQPEQSSNQPQQPMSTAQSVSSGSTPTVDTADGVASWEMLADDATPGSLAPLQDPESQTDTSSGSRPDSAGGDMAQHLSEESSACGDAQPPTKTENNNVGEAENNNVGKAMDAGLTAFFTQESLSKLSGPSSRKAKAKRGARGMSSQRSLTSVLRTFSDLKKETTPPSVNTAVNQPAVTQQTPPPQSAVTSSESWDEEVDPFGTPWQLTEYSSAMAPKTAQPGPSHKAGERHTCVSNNTVQYLSFV